VTAALKQARSVVVLTGAGISAESGLRTFRETMEGLWKEFDPMTLATPEAWEADPEKVSRWYDSRRLGCLAAEPNPGHVALAEIEGRLTGRGREFTLLTQNVDRLHQKAGSRNVVELHGSIIEWRCTECGRKVVPGAEAMTEFPPRSLCCAGDGLSARRAEQGRLTQAAREKGRSGKSGIDRMPMPLLRPDVVWFGEMLPEAALAAAQEAVAACDLFFSIGTSSVVQPAASYIHWAAQRGARTVEINKDPTPISELVDWSIRGKSGEVLPALVAGAFGG
jgi:NAD-dependent protein deacetylase/lipoamidase